MNTYNITVMDAADIWAYECQLPGDVAISALTVKLAEKMRMPLVGSDNFPVSYGLIRKGGEKLDSSACLDDLDISKGTVLRLVPLIRVGSEELPAHDSVANVSEDTLPTVAKISVSEPMALLHDLDLMLKPDVRIDAHVHRQIEEYAFQDRTKECAGLLLGTVNVEGRSRVISIQAFVPALGAECSRTDVAFTLEAWESMLIARDNKYAALRVLGWFHTHAGWGVFMSDSDLFVHRHYFPHPNMVAYVLDPTVGRDGFFYWQEGKLALCPGYGLVGSSVEMKSQNSEQRQSKSKGRPDVRDGIIVSQFIIIYLLGYALIIGHPKAAQSPVENPKPATVRVHVPMVPSSRTERSNNSNLARSAKSASAADTIYYIGHGENMWIICNRVYNNGDLAAALAKYNGIKDLSQLKAGQPLRIPPKEVLVNR